MPGRARTVLRGVLASGSAVVGLLLVLAVGALVLLGPMLAPFDPLEPDFLALHVAPLTPAEVGGSYLLGTDGLGRDLWSRLLHGGRLTLASSLLCLVLSLFGGGLFGVLAGFYGGWVESVIMRLTDLLLSFPSILLAILLVASLGPSLQNAILAVAVVTAPQYTRLLRACVLDELTREYVTAARALGASDARLLLRTVLPNCIGPVVVQSTLGMAVCILETSGLSFLGLGAQPPSPEWGAMLLDGMPAARTAPWGVLVPGVAIFVAVLGVNLLGDGLRQALDPRLNRERG